MFQSSAIAGALEWSLNSALQSPGSRARDIVAERFADLVRHLAFHQSERNLGGSLRRDHRLGALAGIAADDAVDVAGRARRNLLDQEAILLAGGKRQPDRLQERLRRES